ncbi:hypothetical protein Tco_1492540 [Tanacetum coccineum]
MTPEAPLAIKELGFECRVAAVNHHPILQPSTSQRQIFRGCDVRHRKRLALLLSLSTTRSGNPAFWCYDTSWAYSRGRPLGMKILGLMLETQLTASLGCIEILKATDLEPRDGPTEAGSSCTKGVIGPDLHMGWRNGNLSFLISNCSITRSEFKAIVASFMQEAIDLLHRNYETQKMLTVAESSKQRIKDKFKILQETTNNSAAAIQKNERWRRLTLLAPEIRSLKEPNSMYQFVISLYMGHVLKSALTAKRLATRPVTVKADLLLLTTTTTREPKGQIQEGSLALSVEFKVTSGVDFPKLKNGN